MFNSKIAIKYIFTGRSITQVTGMFDWATRTRAWDIITSFGVSMSSAHCLGRTHLFKDIADVIQKLIPF